MKSTLQNLVILIGISLIIPFSLQSQCNFDSEFNISHINCYGETTGTVDIILSNGAGPFSYTWSSGETTDNIGPIGSGTYIVTITDISQCSIIDTAIIESPQDLIINYQKTNPICYADNDGEIALSISGGTPSYAFLWSNGETNDTITNLSPGIYTVTVTDANSCIKTESISLTSASEITYTFETTHAGCTDDILGTASIQAAGGVTPYTYYWSKEGESIDFNGEYQDSLSIGAYNVLIYDNIGCIVSTTIEIEGPEQANVVVNKQNIKCNGEDNGSIDLTLSGGLTPYNFIWSNGETTEDLSNLSEDAYFVTINDSNNCQIDTIHSEFTPVQFRWNYTNTGINHTILAQSTLNPTINGLPINIGDYIGVFYTRNSDLVCGGYEQWTGASIAISVWGDDGTSSLKDGFTSGETINYKIWRESDGAVFDAIGIYSFGLAGYSTNGISGLLSLTATGQGTPTVTQNNGISIIEPEKLSIDSIILSEYGMFNLNCGGEEIGTAKVFASGGTTPLSISWSHTNDNNFELTGLGAGTYSFTITDSNNCMVDSTFEITEPTPISLQSNFSEVICIGSDSGYIQTVASGGLSPYTFVWSNSSFSTSQTQLTPGTYSVLIFDSRFCTYKDTFIIEESDPTNYNMILNEPACFGENTGTITIENPNNTYNFIWSNASTENTITNLLAGQYSVTATNEYGCTSDSTFTLSQPDSMIFEIDSINHILCSGDNSGELYFHISGGLSPYFYTSPQGSGSSDSIEFHDISAGIISINITDVTQNCSIDTTIEFNEPDAISISANITDVDCFGNENGEIDLTVIGGTMPISFVWSNGETTEDINELASGNYTIAIVDANGCSLDTNFTVSQPDQFLITASITDVACYAEETGGISLSITGGTAPFNYLWNSGSMSKNLNNVAAGVYSINISDDNQCLFDTSFTISQADELILSAELTQIDCYGNQNGEIDLSVSGGTTPYSYAWSNNATTQDISILSSNDYSVILTDNNNCTIDTAFTINEPDAISISANITDVDCFGNENGEIDLTVIGGTMPINFVWSNGETTEDINELASGNYTLAIVDANGCSLDTNFTVSQPDQFQITASITDIACYGEETGGISLSITGGTAPFNYLWNSGSMSKNLNNVTAGVYSINISDDNQCQFDTSFTISQADELILSAELTQIDCYGNQNGEIDLSVSGGTTPYSYSWSNNATTQDISILSSNDYSVILTDNNNCTIDTAFTINEPDEISISANITNVDCFGNENGEIDLTVIGGTMPISFVWSNGETTEDINELASGNYTLAIVDANGCSLDSNFTISQPDQFQITASITDVACYGEETGGISLSITGGTAPFNYSWNSGSISKNLNNVAAGVYSINISDDNQCQFDTSFTINENPEIEISAIINDAECSGGATGSIDISVIGGTPNYTYLWSNQQSTEDLNNLSAGIYNLTITDNLSCISDSSFTINSGAMIEVINITTDVECTGDSSGSIVISVTGGSTPYQYLWNSGETNSLISDKPAGNYSITVTDGNSCVWDSIFVISEPIVISASLVASNIDCYGDSTGAIDVTVSGGIPPYTYNWSNSEFSKDLSNISAGTYYLTISDSYNCSKSYSETVLQNSEIIITENIINQVCPGVGNSSISVSANGGISPYTFEWNTGSSQSNIENLASGTFIITVTDALSCTNSESYIISEIQALLDNETITDVNCFGGSDGQILLNPTGGTLPYSYSWNDNSTIQNRSNITAGYYYLTITDFNNCDYTFNYNIAEPTDLMLSAFGDENICPETTAMAGIEYDGGTQPYSFLWSNNATTESIINLSAGTYFVTLSDFNGCIKTDSIIITEYPDISFTYNTSNPTCHGESDGTIVINSAIQNLYSWSNGNFTAANSNLSAGIYLLTITDVNQCSFDTSFTLIEPNELAVYENVSQLGCTSYSNASISLTASGGTAPYSCLWNTGSTNFNLINLTSGIYSYSITDANTCTITDSVEIYNANTISVNPTSNDITCHDFNDGFVVVNPTGGTPPFNFLWSTGSTINNITNLAEGIYSLTLNDNGGCETIEYYTINNPAPLATTIYTNHVSSTGGNDGSVSVYVSGGTGQGTYQYNWDDPLQQTTATITGLTAGWYHVTITDANLCTTIDSSFVTEPLCEAMFSYQIINEAVYFTNLTQGVSTNYSWDFDDNTTVSNDTNPVHYYLQGGYYTVCLTSFDNITGCQSVYCENIYIPDTNVVSCDAQFSYIAIDTSLTFSNNSLGAFTDAYWQFGDNTFSYEMNPNHEYNNGGNYQVCLTVWDTVSGCQASICENIVVLDPVIVNCNANFNFFVDDTTVFFTNASSGNYTSLQWDFDDGNISNLSNPVHNYDNGGYYDVVLTVFDSISQCMHAITKQVQAIDPIVVFCNAEFTYFPVDTTVTFANYSTGSYTNVQWNFGDGNFSTELNPIHHYNNGGNYQVCLSIFDSIYNCQNTRCVNIQVDDPIIVYCNADFTTYIQGATVYTTNTSQGDFTNNIWKFGNIYTAYGTNASYTFSTGGNKTIRLTIQDTTSGCISQIQKTVFIPYQTFANCQADFNYFPIDNYVSFQNISTGNYTSVTWDLDDGDFTSVTNPTKTFTSGGYKNITLTVFDNVTSCVSSMSKQIWVPAPTACLADFVYYPDSMIHTFANTSLGLFQLVNWNFGDGNISSDYSPVHTYSIPGSYTVTLTVTDTINSCINTYSEEIIVGDLCNADFTQYSTPFGETFFSNLSSGYSLSYFWDFDDGIFSILENPVHTYQNQGYYTVTLSTFDQITGCIDYSTKTIFVNAADECAADYQHVTVNNKVFFYDNSTGDYTDVWWDFNDGTGSSLANPVHTYAIGGNYDVSLVVYDSITNCMDEMEKQITVFAPATCNANFQYFPTNLSLALQNTSTGVATDYFWDFDDGTFSTLQNPLHVFDEDGNYNVCLTVYDSISGCTDTYCKEFLMIDTSLSVCNATFSYISKPNKKVKFNPNAIGSYQGVFWDFDDGFNSNVENPNHTFPEDGYYNVCLSIIDNFTNCFDTYCEVIAVGDPTESVKADFIFFPDANDSLKIHFTDKSFGNPISWYWAFDDNSPADTTQNPTYTYTEAGYYRVCLTVENIWGSQETYCKIIPVGDVTYSSYAFFTYFADSITSTAHFNNKSRGEFDAYSYSWDFGDGVSSTQKNPSHTYADTGYYAVCLKTTTVFGQEKTYCKDVRIGNALANPCIIGCVWPGDANKDLEANQYDLLTIGLNYGMEGPQRDSVSNFWTGQYGQNWSTYQLDGTNNKHGDCNGDGIINEDDTLAIIQNFAFSHYEQPDKNNATWFIKTEWDPDTTGLKAGADKYRAKVRLRRATKDSLNKAIYDERIYGLGFEIEIPNDDGLIYSSIEADWQNSMLGVRDSNMLAFIRTDSVKHRIFIGCVRIDHVNTLSTTPQYQDIASFTAEFIQGYDTTGISLLPYSNGGIRANGSNVVIVGENSISQWHKVAVQSGWNMVSSFLNPNFPSIDDFFGPIDSVLIIVKDEYGGIYWPTFNINSIGNVTLGRAYLINVSSADTLTVTGTPIDPDTTGIALPQGYSMIGYLRTSSGNAVDMLSSITQNIVIVKDDKGFVYWPYYNFNNIGDMEPGEGYSIKMANADTLYYPSNGLSLKQELKRDIHQRFPKLANTGKNMTICIPENAWIESPEPGDEIGVFDTHENLVGSYIFSGSNSVFTIWGNDELTNHKEALNENEEFLVKIWNSKTNTLSTIRIDEWIVGSSEFKENEIAVAAKAEIISESLIDLYQNTPNPFNNKTSIKIFLSQHDDVSLKVFDQNGRLIKVLYQGNLQSGYHNFTFDGKKLPSGNYLYKLETSDYTESKNMNFIK